MNKILESIKNSACAYLNPHLFEPEPKRKVVKARNDCKEVQWIHWQLKYWCEERKIELEPEYQFAKKGRIPKGMKSRKFRFDFALPDHKIAIEYDGINSEKSGHTSLAGFTKDTEKINLAIELGWRVNRYTVLNYQNVLQDLKKLIP